MAVGPWVPYNCFTGDLGTKTHDLSSDTLKVALFLSTSNCDDSTLTGYAALTNEHANANGYTTGGVAVVATWAEVLGVATLTFQDAAWAPAGGNIVARFAVLYNDTSTGKRLIARALLDDTPADVTAIPGQLLKVGVENPGDPMLQIIPAP